MKILPILYLAAALAPTRTPEAAYQGAVRDASRIEGRGEEFCWHAAYHIRQFVRGWQASGDTTWLDWGVKYYDWLLGERLMGPDGYRGWIGPYMYDKKVWQDSHVGDAILAGGMLEFAEVAPAGKYGEAASRYVAAARRDVLEKWDHRGTFHTDGPHGAYVGWEWFADPGNKNWSERKGVDRGGLNHPFNKQNDMGLVALRLYRITGEKALREKAERLFGYMRSRFHLVGDRWAWNYWEPFGVWDLDTGKGRPRHWVGVHPYRNYQAREVEQVVEAYHSGIVFSRQDIERIVRTNLEVMWNRDREKPQFVNSDNDLPGGAEKRARLKPPPGEGLAGTLWTALADFSQTIRDLRRSSRRGAPEGPPSFNRRYAKEPASLPQYPESDSKELNLAAALPAEFEHGKGTWLVSNSLTAGEMQVDLFSPDGSKKLKSLHKATLRPSDGMLVWRWEGADAGRYRVRWSVGGGYREVMVVAR